MDTIMNHALLCISMHCLILSSAKPCKAEVAISPFYKQKAESERGYRV